MRKPNPGKTAQKTDKEGGKSSSSEQKKNDSKITSQVIGKGLDLVKEVARVGGAVIELQQEKERTKQAEVNAYKEVEKAREGTKQVMAETYGKVVALQRGELDSQRAHEEKMAELQMQDKALTSRLHQQERVLDKMLDTADSPAQLVDGYRALLISPNKP
jgi:hypothetical protein